MIETLLSTKKFSEIFASNLFQSPHKKIKTASSSNFDPFHVCQDVCPCHYQEFPCGIRFSNCLFPDCFDRISGLRYLPGNICIVYDGDSLFTHILLYNREAEGFKEGETNRPSTFLVSPLLENYPESLDTCTIRKEIG